jgi:hypothetical protein
MTTKYLLKSVATNRYLMELNEVAFTTVPEAVRATRYPSDLQARFVMKEKRLIGIYTPEKFEFTTRQELIDKYQSMASEAIGLDKELINGFINDLTKMITL